MRGNSWYTRCKRSSYLARAVFVNASPGNLQRPMSNAQLEAKFRDQAVPLLGGDEIDRLIARCWTIEALEDVGSAFAPDLPQDRTARGAQVIGS